MATIQTHSRFYVVLITCKDEEDGGGGNYLFMTSHSTDMCAE